MMLYCKPVAVTFASEVFYEKDVECYRTYVLRELGKHRGELVWWL